MSEKPKWEFSKKASVVSSAAVSLVLNAGLMSTDTAPKIEWTESGDTIEKIVNSPTTKYYVEEGATLPGEWNGFPTPRCQIIDERTITIDQEPDQQMYTYLPVPVILPIFKRKKSKDSDDINDNGDESTEEATTETALDNPLPVQDVTSEDQNEAETLAEEVEKINEDTSTALIPTTKSYTSNYPSTYTSKENRHMRKQEREARLKRYEKDEKARLKRYEKDLSSINSREVLLPSIRKGFLLSALLGSLGVGAGYGYYKSEFEGKSCFIDVNKDKDSFDPGLNLHWDCKIDWSLPEQPTNPTGGQNPTPPTENKTCENVPVYKRKITNLIIDGKTYVLPVEDVNLQPDL